MNAGLNPSLRRRDVLAFLALAPVLGPARTWAHTVNRLLGPVEPAYVRMYFARLWDWYGREFAPLAADLSAHERAWLAQWLGSLGGWGFALGRDQLFEHFQFAHRVDGTHVDHRRLSVGLTEWPAGLRAQARRLLRHRGVGAAALPEADTAFFGLGWNFARGECKAYFLHRQAAAVQDPELRAWSLAHAGAEWWPPRLSCFTFHGGRLVRKKLIVPLRRLDWSLISPRDPFDATAAMKIISSDTGVRWHLRLRSLFYPALNGAAPAILSPHAREFQQLGHALLYETRDRYTLYYP